MNGTRTKKSIVNILFNLASQLLSLITAFVMRSVFIQVFATKYLGLNAVFADVLSLISLADLGLGAAMSFSLYKPLAEGDKQKLAALTGFYVKLYQRVAAIVGGLGLCAVPLLPLLIDIETDVGRLPLTVYYLISLAKNVIAYLFVGRYIILSADQKNYITAVIDMVITVLRTSLQLVVLLHLKSYAAYLAMDTLCALFYYLITFRVTVRKYPYLRERVELDRAEAQEIYKSIRAIFLHKISSLLMNATDNILISVIVSTASAGLYSNYILIQSKLTKLTSLFFSSLTASVGNLIVKEGPQRRYDVFRCEQTVCFLICSIVVPCYTVLVNDFISIWLGEDFLFSDLVICAMGCNLYMNCVLYPLWSYREATGLYTRTKWIMIVCSLLNIVLSVLMGLWLGTAGILFASALSRLSTYVWYEPKLLFREYFGTSARPFFKKLLLNEALVAGMTLCIGRIGLAFPALSWTAWLLKAVLTGSACLIIAGVVYGFSSDLSPLWDRLRPR